MDMRRIVRWAFVVVAMLGGLALPVRAQGLTPAAPDAPTQSATAQSCHDGCTSASRLTILAWHGLFGANATPERFSELAAAGFTHNLGWFGSVEELRKALDAAAPAGVKLIARAPLLDSDPEAFAAQVKDHPAFGGYLITDEPGATAFDQLGQLVRRLQAVDGDHLCYINLFPDWADRAKQLEAEDYEQYLRLFVQKVPVQVISFDHYPVVKGGIRGSWYRNLEQVARASAEAGKPFWAFALSIPHTAYPTPTLEHLRLQQYTNLAYGAQGLQYFTYTTPSMDEYGSGPLDRDLNRTPIYDLLVQLNRELRARAWVFVGCHVLNVGHIGSHSPEGAAMYTPAMPIRSLDVQGRGAVVSLLENEDRQYLVIVNHSYVKPAPIQVTWQASVTMHQVGRDGRAIDLPGDSFQGELDPGDVCILGWRADAPASTAASAPSR